MRLSLELCWFCLLRGLFGWIMLFMLTIGSTAALELRFCARNKFIQEYEEEGPSEEAQRYLVELKDNVSELDEVNCWRVGSGFRGRRRFGRSDREKCEDFKEETRSWFE